MVNLIQGRQFLLTPVYACEVVDGFDDSLQLTIRPCALPPGVHLVVCVITIGNWQQATVRKYKTF